MSAITFPNSPSPGEQHTINGITYTFTDGTWVAVGQSNFYTLPTGSPTVLGGVKGGGTGITIANDGVISFSGTTFGTSDVDTHLNQSNPTSGYVLSWNGSDYAWVDNAGYSNTDVDTHLNQSNPTGGYVLSWSGTDYAWVEQSSGTTINNNAAERIVTGSATAGELNADSNLTLAANGTLTLNGSFVVDQVNLNGDVVQLNGGTGDLKVRGNGTGGAHHLTLDDHVAVAGDITIKYGLKDKDSELGTNGQVLISTGTQVDWVDASTLSTSSAIPAFQSSWRIPL